MSVTLYHANLFQERQQIYQFLLSCKETLSGKNREKIVSLSLRTHPIDPLAVLHEIAKPEGLHFYLEKPKQGEAIAAIDAAIQIKLNNAQRFSKAKEFINACLANTIATGDLSLPFSGPHFFCSFTFFDENINSASDFPASTIFLPQWQVASQKEYGLIVANLVLNSQENLEEISETVWRNLQTIKSIKNKKIVFFTRSIPKVEAKYVAETTAFQSSVISALKTIESKQINKIVLANAIDVTYERPLNLFHSLNNLRQVHPDCYIFSTSNGKGKNFIGASPERLIRIQNQQLETDALAGSAPRGKTVTEDAYFADKLLRSEKEKREHRVVIDFILQRLSKLGLTPHFLPLPCLLQLSNIQHLWTPIRAKVPVGVHPLEIVAELHPTPAVAGVPREIACQQIQQYEAFDRSVYAAPLGWIDRQGNSEFIVGIRSAVIEGNNARLFAGAGIVSGSDPEKEIAEIQLKLQALLKALV